MIREIAKRSGDEQKLVGDDCCECTDCAHGEDCGCVDVPQEPEQTPDDEGNNQ